MLKTRENVEAEMRFLGINKSCRGVGIILEVLFGNKEFDNLTGKEYQEIVDAWDSRNFIPVSTYKRFTPVVKTPETRDITLEGYNKKVSKNVILFFSRSAA